MEHAHPHAVWVLGINGTGEISFCSMFSRPGLAIPLSSGALTHLFTSLRVSRAAISMKQVLTELGQAGPFLRLRHPIVPLPLIAGIGFQQALFSLPAVVVRI
jgi:hypothetical protein